MNALMSRTLSSSALLIRGTHYCCTTLELYSRVFTRHTCRVILIEFCVQNFLAVGFKHQQPVKPSVFAMPRFSMLRLKEHVTRNLLVVVCGDMSTDYEYKPVAPVAFQVILEPGIGQFRDFESARVHNRINSWGFFLAHKLTRGKRESES